MADYIRKTLSMTKEVGNLLALQVEKSPFKNFNEYLSHLIFEQNNALEQASINHKLECINKEIEGIKSSISDIKKYLEQAELDQVTARKFASAGYIFSMQSAGKSVEKMQSEIDRVKAESNTEIEGRHT